MSSDADVAPSILLPGRLIKCDFDMSVIEFYVFGFNRGFSLFNSK